MASHEATKKSGGLISASECTVDITPPRPFVETIHQLDSSSPNTVSSATATRSGQSKHGERRHGQSRTHPHPGNPPGQGTLTSRPRHPGNPGALARRNLHRRPP